MKVKRIAECSKGEHSGILLTFIKLSFVFKIFVCLFLSGRLRQVSLYNHHLACLQPCVDVGPPNGAYVSVASFDPFKKV